MTSTEQVITMASASEMKKRYYYSCSVLHCLNTTKNCAYTFFTFPNNIERRAKWLSLISRQDLLNKQTNYHRVCEGHFNPHEILSGKKRKLLKSTALPSLQLPEYQKNDSSSQTDQVFVRSILTQTFCPTVTKGTQSAQYLIRNNPEIKKLKMELSKCKRIIKTNEDRIQQKDSFSLLCNKYLTKELAELVRAQTHLKLHMKGSRYSQDCLKFCLNLHTTSPKAYRLLQTALCLPCPNILYKNSNHIKSENRNNNVNLGLPKIHRGRRSVP